MSLTSWLPLDAQASAQYSRADAVEIGSAYSSADNASPRRDVDARIGPVWVVEIDTLDAARPLHRVPCKMLIDPYFNFLKIEGTMQEAG